MIDLLRSNSFTRSTFAKPEGCSGKIPQAAIAARGDLQPNQVSCSWAAEDFMVGRRAYGAIDAKATTVMSRLPPRTDAAARSALAKESDSRKL